MSTRAFVAATAREALARARSELGDAAVVLTTREHARGVEVLASAYADLLHVDAAPDPASGSRILREV
jgi:flagellar biosynthesis protein FlhF